MTRKFKANQIESISSTKVMLFLKVFSNDALNTKDHRSYNKQKV